MTMTPHRDRLLAGDYDPGKSATTDLDQMTKAELLEHAQRLGVAVDPSATKAEVRAAIDAAGS